MAVGGGTIVVGSVVGRWKGWWWLERDEYGRWLERDEGACWRMRPEGGKRRKREMKDGDFESGVFK